MKKNHIIIDADNEKKAIVLIVKKLNSIKPTIGAYIEHYLITEKDILVKLSNGFFKIKANSLTNLQSSPNDLPCSELQRIAKSYINYLL
ncbi:MAG: hypothetical protein EAZ51_05335 [Sphingobacteriales bacterium]|nr:MAG: hypothetical protein EAZ64_06225 [Sphingobacteriales bacterium]TAF80799.1 MAG: hypothetical protein EAZ51_05335 [Sphingobacteriales bacterium]